jgi:hypothetical protein
MRLVRFASALIAITASTVLAGAGTAVAQPAAARIRELNLNSDVARVTTTTGVHLYLQVFANADNQFGGDSEAQVGLTSANGESHSWDLTSAPHQALTFSDKHGGQLVIKQKAFGGYAAIHLTITPRGKPKTKTCSANSASVHQPVTLKGTVEVHTHSAAWGTVRADHPKLTFKGFSNIEIDTGRSSSPCVNGGSNDEKPGRCDGDVEWDGPSDPDGPGGFLNGEGNGEFGLISYFNFRTLDSRRGIEFETNDFVPGTGHPPVLTTTDTGTTQVSVTGAGTHGLFTGTATLTSVGQPTTETRSCKGKTREWKASFEQGANPLTVHNAIGGDFSPKSAATGADFSQQPSH